VVGESAGRSKGRGEGTSTYELEGWVDPQTRLDGGPRAFAIGKMGLPYEHVPGVWLRHIAVLVMLLLVLEYCMALGCAGWLVGWEVGAAADVLPLGWILRAVNTWGRLWLKSARY